MEHWNNRVFLLTMTALPVACSHDVTEQFFGEDSGRGSTTTAPVNETTTGGSSGSSGPQDNGSTSMDVTATGSGTDGTSTSDATGGSSTGEPESSGDSTGGDSDGGSSTTAAPTLCEAWGQAIGACSGYGAAYHEQYCEYYLASPVCTAELLETFECEAYDAGFCGAGCEKANEALAACKLQVEAEELGCYDLPATNPTGMLEAACLTTAQKALACDQSGAYVNGFSQYADYADGLQLMQSFCTSGAYWTFGVDPLSACGGAYEDLLACIQPLSCSEFDEVMLALPLDDLCAEAAAAVECACNLGIG